MSRPVPSLEESKRTASLLEKDLHSLDIAVARAAATRFLRLAEFRQKSADELVRDRDEVQHKHALTVVAREQGYGAWKNLKDAADVLWCPPGASAYWHNWCKSHDEARAILDERGGYLLTAHGKWFIAERGYIELLGLDPDDPRWAAIGFDIVQPSDQRACHELIALRESIAKSTNQK